MTHHFGQKMFGVDVSLILIPDALRPKGQEASVSIPALLLKVWVTLSKSCFHPGQLPISPGVRPFCERVLPLEQGSLAVLTLQTGLHGGFEQGLWSQISSSQILTLPLPSCTLDRECTGILPYFTGLFLLNGPK